ncbi:MAG: hypothetical protein F4Y11_01150 [Chloroflexi bacterium]|nr:hypothetical protein [Chloroflexota bacterium]
MKTSFRHLARFSELTRIALGRVFFVRVLVGVVEQSTGIIGAGLSRAAFAMHSLIARPTWQLEQRILPATRADKTAKRPPAGG